MPYIMYAKQYTIQHTLYTLLTHTYIYLPVYRIETAGGDRGTEYRNLFLKIMGSIGVVEYSFLDAAIPRL